MSDSAGEQSAEALTERARRAARSACTLLLTGETGVGKGHLARLIHDHSPRRDGPFVPVSCGAIPEPLVESQLFGHVRGAIEGATSDHSGLIRAADTGTLFLDEIGELPHPAQTRLLRLLRLLQDRKVQPVGHPRPVVVDVRIISATTADLHADVATGRFRQDLLLRVDVIRLDVRPLRERTEEIAGLVDVFNREFGEVYAQRPLHFDPAAMDMLRSHYWPGNVRELRTVVERLHVLRPEERVTAEQLVDVGMTAPAGPTPSAGWSLERARNEQVLRVLVKNGGSVARTAVVFGVHRSTIYRWLQSHDRGGRG
ncbi:MAG: sigma-54-dependent Fis family transcriptional regulator [Planctomycetes bacterium]|nr:sigma-54-dependent Fis family transcriptional regulator [Planctomycetota bacterium]